MKGQIRLLLIGPYPPPYSGPELVMKGYLDSDLTKVFETRFLKTNFRNTNVNKARLDISMLAAFWHFLFRLITTLAFFKPDVVYYPITTTQIGWIGRDVWCLLMCRLLGVPVMIHLQASSFRLNLEHRFSPVVRRLVAYACRGVALALVQAECLKDQFKGLVPSDRIAVLYNSVDVNEFRQGDTLPSAPRVLFMGHLTKAKGYCDLVRAIGLVATRFPRVTFSFAGTLRRGERGVFFDQTNGSPLVYEDPVVLHEEMSRSVLAPNYEYCGVVTGEAKRELLRSTSVFVLPSYSEGFSCALLEAMAAGKPVVCTPVGAHREVIRDGVHGFVVQPGDASALADRICRLLSDESLRTRIGSANRKYVTSQFSHAAAVRALKGYVKLVGGAQKRVTARTQVEESIADAQ